jgi:hypothetical protein
VSTNEEVVILLKPLSPSATRAVSLFLCGLILGSAFAQDQPPPAPAPPPPDQTLAPNQLDDLVAPVALYPDPLLSQLLVAATYPLEVVQAYQWLQRNPGIQGQALTQAAQQQNWDASVQALVMFPDVLKRLNDDVTWTTNLGNAFLAQEKDVMDAVQRMRAKAQQAGKLASTSQQNVVPATQDGQPVIEIEPTDPNVLYVPVYDPAWVWGPALWYPYPRWFWPPYVGGIGFGIGINVGFFFGVGWHGWGGWGWHPGWGNRTVIVNNTFIHQNNFNTGRVEGVHGTSTWVHDPGHRLGVPYSRAELNSQYRATVRQNVEPRPSVEQTRNALEGQGERLGNREVPRNAPQAQGRSAFGGQEYGRAAQTHAEHGYSSMGAARSAPASRPSAPARGGGRR